LSRGEPSSDRLLIASPPNCKTDSSLSLVNESDVILSEAKDLAQTESLPGRA
jgi:hypothetical protein